jgi:DNA-binding NtrC family response regulator
MPIKRGNILIVDDNEGILRSLDFALKREFKKIVTIKNPNILLESIRTNEIDVVLLDMNFTESRTSGNEGIFWLREIIKQDNEAIVIMITAYGDIKLAVNAMKEGATDFILKPWEISKLIATIKSAVALRKSRKEVKLLTLKKENLTEVINNNDFKIIGDSKAISEVLKVVDKVASTNANILIYGENGTGKELIARRIHQLSENKSEIFLPVDINAINPNLIESELFGHIEGAFTDAKKERIGKFETASGGTLFLDEIGNIDLQVQGKILSSIQNKEIYKVGSNTKMPINIRLVSATNKNLEELVKKNEFREDLLYRINTITIRVPSLKERKEDISKIAHFYLDRYQKNYNKSNMKLTVSAIKKLESYHWPGNIRELQHAIEKAVILSSQKQLNAEAFDFSTTTNDHKLIESLNLQKLEKAAIINALNKHRGNMSKAAEELGITRKTLYKKKEKYDF